MDDLKLLGRSEDDLEYEIKIVKATGKDINPLPSLTLQSARDLNVPCQPKRSKALVLSSS